MGGVMMPSMSDFNARRSCTSKRRTTRALLAVAGMYAALLLWVYKKLSVVPCLKPYRTSLELQ